MRAILLNLGCLFLLAGCAVRGGDPEESAPIWWPAFVVKAPAGSGASNSSGIGLEPVQIRSANGLDGAVSTGMKSGGSTSGGLPPPGIHNGPDQALNFEDVNIPVADRTPLFQPKRAPVLGPVPFPELNSATVYPNRGEAALAAHSATLYPPNGIIVTDPARNASVYPNGQPGNRGFVGK